MNDHEQPALPEPVAARLREISERLEVMQEELDARAPVAGPTDDGESPAT